MEKVRFHHVVASLRTRKIAELLLEGGKNKKYKKYSVKEWKKIIAKRKSTEE